MKTRPNPKPKYPVGMAIGCRVVVCNDQALTAKSGGTSYWRERVQLACAAGHTTWNLSWNVARVLSGQCQDRCNRCTPRDVNRSDCAVERVRRGKICGTCADLWERRQSPVCPECKRAPAREAIERSSGYSRTEDALEMAS